MRSVFTAITLSISALACMPTDIDFSDPNPDCEEIKGDRMVETKSQARDLSLSDYCIEGTLFISGDFVDMTDFAGLQRVTELHLIDNQKLASLDGLSRVIVKKSLVVTGNTELKTITNRNLLLNTTLNTVTLRENKNLEDISAFETVETITGDLHYVRNGGLKDLRSFENLRTLEGSLEIRENSGLTTIKGFTRLTGSGGSSTVDQNPSLKDLNGFTVAFGVVGGDLTMTSNPVLTDASGWSLHLDTVNGAIRVEGNSSLSQCRADEFEAILDSALIIDSNGATFEPCYPL